MEKTDLKAQRMREYFIQATAEILKAEGLRAVSVRTIAERTGYSYATLYNYFDDAKDLIFECVKGFLNECRNFIESEIQTVEKGLPTIKEIVRAYTKYFVQYPGIFELFYMEQPSDLVRKKQTIDLIVTFTDQLCAEEWSSSVSNGQIAEEEVKIIADELRYAVLGLLLLYLTKKHPATYDEFVQKREQLLDRILTV